MQVLADTITTNNVLGKPLVWVNSNLLVMLILLLAFLDKLEVIKEYKVEMICTDDHLPRALEAMKFAHPYEEIAYTVIKMENQ